MIIKNGVEVEQWHDQEAPVAPVVAPQGVEVPRGEVEQIVRAPGAAALLPGQAQGLSFQSLSPKPVQPLSFCESRGLVLFVNRFSLQQLSKQILCQEGRLEFPRETSRDEARFLEMHRPFRGHFKSH
jgi:hypothetical protein